jgi:hypothetical protein
LRATIKRGENKYFIENPIPIPVVKFEITKIR